MNNISKSRRNIFLCAVVSALSAGACADAPETDVEPGISDADDTASPAAQQSGGDGKIRIKSVSAFGTGCPSGSWDAFVSSDGLALHIGFDKYFLEGAPNKPTLQSTNCQVTLVLDMPRGYVYGVTKVSYTGYANLEKGVTAEQIADYAWTGLGASSSGSARSKLTGPYDKSWTFSDDVEERGAGIPWTRCDITSNLQIRSRLTLTNNVKGFGYINTTALDAEQDTKLVINLTRKKDC